MISDRHRYVFVHIPRCAGTTIEHVLLSHEGIGIREIGDRGNSLCKKIMIGKGRQHYTVSTLVSLRKDSSGYFKFAFVRNPWSKMLSEYLYVRNQGRRFLTAAQIKRINNFSSFIDLIGDTRKAQPSLSDKNFLASHAKSQSEFLIDENGLAIDFIGKFENLQKDFDIVCNRIGLKETKLRRINGTRHRHYRHYYDSLTKRRVENMFDKDIANFNYEF
jgi:chondroitin 4-sulfotransferase 11